MRQRQFLHSPYQQKTVTVATQKSMPTRKTTLSGRSHIVLPLVGHPLIVSYRKTARKSRSKAIYYSFPWLGRRRWATLAPAQIYSSGNSAGIRLNIRQLSSLYSNTVSNTPKVVVTFMDVIRG